MTMSQMSTAFIRRVVFSKQFSVFSHEGFIESMGGF